MVSENRTSMRITNGKMVEQWLAWDTLDMMQQRGAIPSQVPPTPIRACTGKRRGKEAAKPLVPITST